MSRLTSLVIASCFVATAAGILTAGAQHAARVEIRQGTAPIPFTGSDDRVHFAYELHVTETSRLQNITLERLEVLDGRAAGTLAVYDAHDLDQRTMRPNASRATRYGRLIPGGATAIVHIWISLTQGQAVPRSVRNRLTFTGESIAEHVVELRTSVRHYAPVVLGPPMRGGPWFAHNGPGAHRAAHWGSVLVESRQITIPQRYAIDFIGLDAAGLAVRRDVQGSSNADWIGFGAEVLAVGDGTVREVRDGSPDWAPLYEPPAPAGVGLQFVGGNYVVLELAGRRFIHYVHLQEGSVSVRPGQRVRRGERLGRLGSGNTNGPHLHFNVLDAPSMEQGEGVPFVFDLIETRGATTPDAAFGDAPIKPSLPVRPQRALPLNGAIVSFP
jgi:peptidase M23-like protein